MNGEPKYVMFSPIEDFLYLLNNVFLGECTIEDFILFVGTLVAFVAFILWCCFPVIPREAPLVQQTSGRGKDEDKYNQLSGDYDLSIT